MSVATEGHSQRGVVDHGFREVLSFDGSSSLMVAGSAEQWCMVSRFSHLMAVRIEGRRQRGAVVQGLEVFTFDDSKN